MMYRTAKSQTKHDQIVHAVVNHLVQRGYRNIRADLPGYLQPEFVQGTKQDHIPDVAADGVFVEAETSDTIDSDHTASQCSLFSDYAAKHAQTFRVVVPNDSVATAQNRLDTLDLRAEVYGV